MNYKIKKSTSIEADEVRCSHCNKLLAKAGIDISKYEIKCTRCGTLNSLFMDFHDQIVVTDPDGYILYVNDRVKEITGYKIEEVIGKRPSLWGGLMPKTFYKKMWEDIKNKKKNVLVNLTNRRKNGKKYKAQLRISPVLDTKGEVKMFIGIETITE